MKIKNFNLDEESLRLILKLGLDNLCEDRKNAIEHHDTLSNLLEGTSESDGLSTLEIQMMVQELSAALKNFLDSSTKSTENIIKIAKILSDHIKTKYDGDDVSEEDREFLEEMIRRTEDDELRERTN